MMINNFTHYTDYNFWLKSLGSTAVHGKILLVTNNAKILLILKAASWQTDERTDHAHTLF